jgi:hypothetical protein
LVHNNSFKFKLINIMEAEYIIRTHREGTVKTDSKVEGIITTIGCNCLTGRLLGKVTVIVEKVGGKFTKEKIRMDPDSDPSFVKSVDPDAKNLLVALKAVADGGGDEVEIRVKLVAKQ